MEGKWFPRERRSRLEMLQVSLSDLSPGNLTLMGEK
jgi:hypothetical protein